MPAPATFAKYTLLFNSKANQGGDAAESYYGQGVSTLASGVTNAQAIASTRSGLLGRHAQISAVRLTQYSKDSTPNERLNKLWEAIIYQNTQPDGTLTANTVGAAWTAPDYGMAGVLNPSELAAAAPRNVGAKATWYLSNGTFSHSALIFVPQAIAIDRDSAVVNDADTTTILSDFSTAVAAFNVVLSGPPTYGRFLHSIPNPLQPYAVITATDTPSMTVAGDRTSIFQTGVVVQAKGFRNPRHGGRNMQNGIYQVSSSSLVAGNTQVILSGNGRLCGGAGCASPCEKLGFLYPIVLAYTTFNSSIGPLGVQATARSKRNTAR